MPQDVSGVWRAFEVGDLCDYRHQRLPVITMDNAPDVVGGHNPGGQHNVTTFVAHSLWLCRFTSTYPALHVIDCTC